MQTLTNKHPGLYPIMRRHRVPFKEMEDKILGPVPKPVEVPSVPTPASVQPEAGAPVPLTEGENPLVAVIDGDGQPAAAVAVEPAKVEVIPEAPKVPTQAAPEPAKGQAKGRPQK